MIGRGLAGEEADAVAQDLLVLRRQSPLEQQPADLVVIRPETGDGVAMFVGEHRGGHQVLRLAADDHVEVVDGDGHSLDDLLEQLGPAELDVFALGLLPRLHRERGPGDRDFPRGGEHRFLECAQPVAERDRVQLLQSIAWSPSWSRSSMVMPCSLTSRWVSSIWCTAARGRRRPSERPPDPQRQVPPRRQADRAGRATCTCLLPAGDTA